jgi:hypothetical protein
LTKAGEGTSAPVWGVEIDQPLIGYGLAVGAVATTFTLRLAFVPVLEAQAPYLPFIPAVLLAAGIGGVGPGLLATVLSLFGVWFFILSYGEAGWAEILNSLAFILIGPVRPASASGCNGRAARWLTARRIFSRSLPPYLKRWSS